MPTFEYNPELNKIEYNGEDEIILTKQKAALTINKFEELYNKLNMSMDFKNVQIQGIYGLTLWRKIKLFWKLWKFMK